MELQTSHEEIQLSTVQRHRSRVTRVRTSGRVDLVTLARPLSSRELPLVEAGLTGGAR